MGLTLNARNSCKVIYLAAILNWSYIQGVYGRICHNSGNVLQVQSHRYNKKYQYPNLNFYGDNYERNFRE